MSNGKVDRPLDHFIFRGSHEIGILTPNRIVTPKIDGKDNPDPITLDKYGKKRMYCIVVNVSDTSQYIVDTQYVHTGDE